MIARVRSLKSKAPARKLDESAERRGRFDDPLALIRARPLAKLLGVSRWTIWDWTKRGVLPKPITFGNQYVAWRRADIEQWLRDREEASDAR
jgi:predicted DNA-binding transcriptional regulator AlpA